MTDIDPRLRIPLANLWPDVLVHGLPVTTEDGSQATFFALDHEGGPWAIGNWFDEYEDLYAMPATHLDLSRQGASDALARRVARTECIENCGPWWASWGFHGKDDHHPNHWGVWGFEEAIGVRWFDSRDPIFAALDHTDDTRLDWGPRIVDLVALGIVALHLAAQQ